MFLLVHFLEVAAENREVFLCNLIRLRVGNFII